MNYDKIFDKIQFLSGFNKDEVLWFNIYSEDNKKIISIVFYNPIRLYFQDYIIGNKYESCTYQRDYNNQYVQIQSISNSSITFDGYLISESDTNFLIKEERDGVIMICSKNTHKYIINYTKSNFDILDDL